MFLVYFGKLWGGVCRLFGRRLFLESGSVIVVQNLYIFSPSSCSRSVFVVRSSASLVKGKGMVEGTLMFLEAK